MPPMAVAGGDERRGEACGHHATLGDRRMGAANLGFTHGETGVERIDVDARLRELRVDLFALSWRAPRRGPCCLRD